MTETTITETLATLRAARAGIVSAMTMHVERAEELAIEKDKIDREIAELQAGGAA